MGANRPKHALRLLVNDDDMTLWRARMCWSEGD